MKKSSFFLFGMLAALLAFGIVVAGCEGPAGPAGANGKDGYPALVKLAANSLGARGDESITGLTSGTYVVKVGSLWYPVATAGTLGATGYSNPVTALNDAGIGASTTAITGLDNTKTYDVYHLNAITRAGTTQALTGGEHEIIVLSAFQVNDAPALAAAGGNAAKVTMLVLNDEITSNSLSATALVANIEITTKDTTVDTFTIGNVTPGGATVEYVKGTKYVTFKNVSATTAFDITATKS